MYLDGTRLGPERADAAQRANACLGATPVWLAGTLAVLLLVAAGVAYRVVASELRTVLNTVIELPVPLRQVPLHIRDWTGEELPIPALTKVYMETNFADDFISRRYVNDRQRLWADVYVVYCSSRRGGILGHQPLVCFPAHGWIHDQTVSSQITSRAGRPIPCLVHEFHKPAPEYQQIVVLSFYVLNGQVTLREKDFSGFLGRMPNLSGDPARYVAQVQISSTFEHFVRVAATDMVDTILSFLPDEHGNVGAAGPAGVRGQADGAVSDNR
jgi:hypothetical protein